MNIRRERKVREMNETQRERENWKENEDEREKERKRIMNKTRGRKNLLCIKCSQPCTARERGQGHETKKTSSYTFPPEKCKNN